MCGISGFVSKDSKKTEITQILKNMTDIIKHRGPDGEGYFVKNNLGLGHRRLAIIDLNINANQPFEDENYVLIFNGEIYNYLELREQLTEYNYLTVSDTEVILAAYDRWGNECVKYFRGMWAFILYDKRKNILFCSRDRFGIKPLYYYDTDENISFASEIKQFTVLPNWEAIGNKNRIHDFFIFGALDHTEETMFKNVKQIPPGNNLIYSLDKNTFIIENYYDLRKQISQYNMNKEYNLKDLMKQSIKEHMISDVAIGSCLSGGLDSSTIVILMNEILKENKDKSTIKTVSSCFKNKIYDEQEYIDEINKVVEAESYKVFPKIEDLFEYLDDIIYHNDEPFGSTSIFAQWNVFREAEKNNIKVMLDGQGADEQLAGYSSFYIAYFNELFYKMEFESLDREINELITKYNYFTKEEIFNRAFKMQLGDLKKIIENKFKRTGRFAKPIFDLYYDYYKELNESMKNIKDFSIHQLTHISLPKLLHYEDRNSMTFSVESRVPFLDNRVVEFVVSSKSEEKISNAITKSILRKSMTGILPKKIANRKDKMGFFTPEGVWIKENSELFKRYFEEGCRYLEDMINKDIAMKWFDEEIKSDGNSIDFTIWRVVCLSRWIEIFKIQNIV